MGGGERIASRSGEYNAPHTPCIRNGERNSPLGTHKMMSRDSVSATEINMYKVFFLILGEFRHSDPNIFHYHAMAAFDDITYALQHMYVQQAKGRRGKWAFVDWVAHS